MLVLSRRTDQEVEFPSLDIRVRILKACGAVKLGIEAPPQVRILRDEVEEAARKGLPTYEEIARLPKEARHELRNRLQTISVGLHLLREHVDQGNVAEAERTMEMLADGINAVTGHPAVAAPQSPVTQPVLRALLVDDEPNEREMLAGFLIMQNFEIVTAESGQMAIDRLRDQAPDIVLLDLNLPDMRGEQVLSWIRQQPELTQLPVYVVSGSEFSETIASGPIPTRVFQKPLNPQLLVQAMRNEVCAL